MGKASKEGTALLREWQKRLGLEHWRIKLVDNLRPDDMCMENVAGCTEWSESVETARIEIMDPAYYGDRITPFDYEKTLVHELLHLKLTLIGDQVETLQERYVHQLIDELARALVDAKRYTVETPPKTTRQPPQVAESGFLDG